MSLMDSVFSKVPERNVSGRDSTSDFKKEGLQRTVPWTLKTYAGGRMESGGDFFGS